MKPALPYVGGLLSHFPFWRALSFGIALLGLAGQTRAEEVDSELLLLVDVIQPGMTGAQFDALMEGYATALSSADVLSSIQSGNHGKIAVSLMMFGNSTTQQVGIPWVTIGSSSDAQNFANLARNVTRPFSILFPDMAAAISAGTASFGTETGATSNGYESSLQIIEVAGTRQPLGDGSDAAAASGAALASGVDVINSVALDSFWSAGVEEYYADNVIGSTVEGVAPVSSSSDFSGALDSLLEDGLSDSVQVGADASIAAVPEPATLLSLLSGMALLLLVRHR